MVLEQLTFCRLEKDELHFLFRKSCFYSGRLLRSFEARVWVVECGERNRLYIVL